ncbi:MFS transporter [Lactococcus lactis]|uniref:MFS transporter n=1 Tax=Lactococcus lactis TaxID=1358 RepID=UPI00071E035F|nr:MFS transporter [Lactococcus lactis]KST87826.1 permease of the major facilitator superfamily [Lactococcus lactis subsp. lactis]
MKIHLSRFRTIMLVVSLFLLNIVEQAASATSATIPNMAATFPHVSETNIELITTSVNLTVTIFVLVSGLVSTRIGQKKTAVIGIAIAAISSIIPVFSVSYPIILASRFILGLGIGLSNPLAISLIGEFFEDDMMAQLMGWRSAVASVGNFVMTALASNLLTINWHFSYLVYLLFAVVLILFVIFVPETKSQSTDSKTSKLEGSLSQGLALSIFMGIVVLIFMSCSMITFIKIAVWFVTTGIGTAAQAGYILSLLGLVMFVASAIFGLVYKFLKQWVLPIMLFLSGFCLLFMTFLTKQNIIGIFALLSAFFGSFSIPCIFTAINQNSSQKSAPMNNAIILVGTNLGSFLSVYFAAILGKTAVDSLRNAGIVIITLSVVLLILFIYQELKKSHLKHVPLQ